MAAKAKVAMAATFLMLFLIAGSLPLESVVVSQTTQTNTAPSFAAGLSIESIPPRLPADGKSYPAIVVGLHDDSGNPSLALNSTVVYLTSSQENVGKVPASVTIPPGSGFVVVNLNTTLTAGITVLTASATGITSAQTTVATRTPSGFATHLKVSAEPGSVLARPGGSGSLTIQLQDDTGAPAEASSDINVSVSSSNNAYAQPSASSVVIRAGSDLAIVNYTSGYTIGSALITATASGFVSGTTTVSIVGSPPFQLKVSAQPNEVVPSSRGRVVIWLEDPSGNPARASSSIPVVVTSSNLTVASMVQQEVTIAAGQIYVTANFTTTSALGASTITASAQGLLSGFDTLRNSPAVHGPAGLKLFVAPGPVLADNTNYQAVLVSIVNSTGSPEVAASNTVVNLTSSDTSVGTVQESITIPQGGEFAIASLHSSYLVGSTVLTASAQGLLSAQFEESSFGPIPASVILLKTAPSIPADGGTYRGLVIMLQDAFGNPAVAPSDVEVQVVSSRPNLVVVDSPVIIKTGQSYGFVSVQTGLSPGSCNVTASASGYASSSALVDTVVPAPAKLGAFLGPATTINSTGGPDALLTVQLQDIAGFPADARVPTSIVVASSNRTVLSEPIMLSVSPGADYASAYVHTSTSGPTNLTASSPGLTSASISLQVLKSPIVFAISPPSATVNATVATPLYVSMSALGQPYKGAKVVWSASSGSVTPANSTTGANGIASTTFIGTTQGLVSVTAHVSSPISRTVNLTAKIFVVVPPAPPKPSFFKAIGPYLWIIIVIVVVVVAVVLFYFFWWRKRMAKRHTAEEEATPPYDELEEAPGEGGVPGGEGEETGEISGEATGEISGEATGKEPGEEAGDSYAPVGGVEGGETVPPQSEGSSDNETV